MGQLETHGLQRSVPEEADLIIVNSCGFIESAKQESINTVIELRRAFPHAKIVLTGCLARRYETELRESLTEADIVSASFDPTTIVNSPAKHPPVQEQQNADGARPLLSLPGSAYIKIAEGCNNRCAFCAIPLMRGPLVSRTIPAIAAEFQKLRERGVHELCLVAQDTASFGFDRGKSELAALLDELSQNTGSFWVRLLYLHPDHFPLDILPVMQRDPRFLPYFDIPFQHASARILSLMGRTGSADQYLELIEKIRTQVPDAILRSTFLTGFPTETTADFTELCRFQQTAALDWAGVFSYSQEEGTRAFAMEQRPSGKLARQRALLLEQNQQPITEKRMERWAGKTLDVLVEETIDGEDGLYIGRAYLHAPEVDGAVVLESETPLAPGSIVTALVRARSGFDLHCQLKSEISNPACVQPAP